MQTDKKPILSTKKPRDAATLDIFISFRDALNKYCDANGIDFMHNSAIRIIRSAAGNTLYRSQESVAACRRHMIEYQGLIPEMFDAIMAMSLYRPLSHHIDALSDISLDELRVILAANKAARIISSISPAFLHQR